MSTKKQNKKIIDRFFKKNIVLIVVVSILGIVLGIGIASIKNVGIIPSKSKSSVALPTKILDKNNKLITSFFSNENRTLINFSDIPKLLMLALITREDQNFLQHHGFSFRGTTRAVWNLLSNNYFSGGSTISQQVAGTIYADRRNFSILRKLKELWWSLQLERSWSKQEIISEYLNEVYFGHGNYGAEAASQYFFGHSATELNFAEAVMLVIQLANPVRYSPFKNPNIAKNRQKEILDQMVALKYISKEQALYDFQNYWINYDYTRAGISSAFLERNDEAPYFSEYIRGILINELNFSNEEINTGGLTIYTTLDLDIQRKARAEFTEGLKKANNIYRANSNKLGNYEKDMYSIAALATLFFDNSGQLFDKNSLQKKSATQYFNSNLQPVVSLLHLMFEYSPNTLAGHVSFESKEKSREFYEEDTVEGALITLDNKNGHIVAMIGGSEFDATNQFNRSVSAFVQPGSSFKPLYYSAAIEEKIITPSTIIWDSPVVFETEDGELYSPQNYKGEWKGKVTVREALSNSMNVPSLKVLNMVGFPKALEIAAGLLDLPKDKWEMSGLVPKFPVGLGIVSVSPYAMAKAYATFANGGNRVSPIAIRYVRDRNGKIINQTEKILRTSSNFSKQQIISTQTAYIITSLLQTTVKRGTLAYAQNRAGGFTQPTAGKTGTTQNWSDSWTLGFTPYYTTALWFGFDRGGQSLGTNQTGALTTGPVWAKYMENINKNLPLAVFEKPQGIITVAINSTNNTKAVKKSLNKVNEIFIAGTEPTEWDHPEEAIIKNEFFQTKLEQSKWNLSIPFENQIDKNIYFDFITTHKKTTKEKENQQNPILFAPVRLRLESPTFNTLHSDLPSTSPSKEDKNNSNSLLE